MVDETEHKEADDADLHLNKLKSGVHVKTMRIHVYLN